MVHIDYSSFKVLKHVDITKWWGKKIACEVAKPKRKRIELLLVPVPLTSRLASFIFIGLNIDWLDQLRLHIVKLWVPHTGKNTFQSERHHTAGEFELGAFLLWVPYNPAHCRVTLFGDILTVISKWGFGFIKLVYCTSPGIPPPDSFSIPGICVTHLPLITSPNWSTRFCHANYFLPNQIWMDWRDDNHSQWMDLQGT